MKKVISLVACLLGWAHPDQEILFVSASSIEDFSWRHEIDSAAVIGKINLSTSRLDTLGRAPGAPYAGLFVYEPLNILLMSWYGHYLAKNTDPLVKGVDSLIAFSMLDGKRLFSTFMAKDTFDSFLIGPGITRDANGRLGLVGGLPSIKGIKGYYTFIPETGIWSSAQLVERLMATYPSYPVGNRPPAFVEIRRDSIFAFAHFSEQRHFLGVLPEKPKAWDGDPSKFPLAANAGAVIAFQSTLNSESDSDYVVYRLIGERLESRRMKKTSYPSLIYNGLIRMQRERSSGKKGGLEIAARNLESGWEGKVVLGSEEVLLGFNVDKYIVKQGNCLEIRDFSRASKTMKQGSKICHEVLKRCVWAYFKPSSKTEPSKNGQPSPRSRLK